MSKPFAEVHLLFERLEYLWVVMESVREQTVEAADY